MWSVALLLLFFRFSVFGGVFLAPLSGSTLRACSLHFAPFISYRVQRWLTSFRNFRPRNSTKFQFNHVLVERYAFSSCFTLRGYSPAEWRPDKGGGCRTPARVCALRRIPGTAPDPRASARTRLAPPLQSRHGRPSRPAAPKQRHACNPSNPSRAGTLTWRGAAGDAWQVQPATVSAPHAACVTPRRAVAYARG